MNVKSLQKLALALVFATISFSSFSDTASHEAAANELLNTMNLNELLEESIEVTLNMELQQNPSMLPYKETMKEFFRTYMSGESLRGDFILLYTETFTEEELKEITAFYLTPTGQKTINTATDLMAKGAAIGQQRVVDNISELQFMIEQEAKRISELQQMN